MTEVALEIACCGVHGSSNRQRLLALFGEAKGSMTSEGGLPEGSELPARKHLVNVTESSCPRPTIFVEATNLAMSDRLGNLMPCAREMTARFVVTSVPSFSSTIDLEPSGFVLPAAADAAESTTERTVSTT